VRLPTATENSFVNVSSRSRKGGFENKGPLDDGNNLNYPTQTLVFGSAKREGEAKTETIQTGVKFGGKGRTT